MDLKALASNSRDGKVRLVLVMVPGKQITIAHVIAKPEDLTYQKISMLPELDYIPHGAMGIISIMPAEAAVIAGDIALKAARVQIGYMDRFRGTLIISGRVADVENAIRAIETYMKKHMNFWVPKVSHS